MSMTDNIEDSISDEKRAAVRSLEMMLDYAMMEGAELKSPLFVLLLRLARLALLDEFENERPRGARTRKSTNTENAGGLTVGTASDQPEA